MAYGSSTELQHSVLLTESASNAACFPINAQRQTNYAARKQRRFRSNRFDDVSGAPAAHAQRWHSLWQS